MVMNVAEQVAASQTQQDLADLWDKYQPLGLWTEDVMIAAKVRLLEIQAQRCRMCVRPARWLSTQNRWAAYCAGMSCTNRERICQSCAVLFVMGAGGAGTKYCSTQCKGKGYYPTRGMRATNCAWCDKNAPHGHGYQGNGNSFWPYICGTCIQPIKHLVDRLKSHHVPHERARSLVGNPGCEICGINLIARVKEPGHGKNTALLVVDHDHGCCPGAHSCGDCVRGLLCQRCNAALGMLADSPTRARALADYLQRTNPQ